MVCHDKFGEELGVVLVDPGGVTGLSRVFDPLLLGSTGALGTNA